MRAATPSRLFGGLSAFFVCIAFVALLYYNFYPVQSAASTRSEGENDVHAQYRAPRHNSWADLTAAEASQVYSFIYSEYPEFNLTDSPKTGLENYINFAEVLRPNKTDALPYINGQDSKPERWAKVAISETIEGSKYISYYAVGPLPISEESTLSPLDYCYNGGRHWIKNPIPSYLEMETWGVQLAANISDITLELLGARANPHDGRDPDGLLVTFRAVWIEDGTIKYWMGFNRPGLHANSRSILPQGIYVKLENNNVVRDDFNIIEWYYNGVLYNDLDEFRAAMRSDDFAMTPPNLGGAWTETEDFDAAPPGRHLPPPVMLQPYGPRYKLDREENFVSWMGFEFYIATNQATGPALFDVRFKGESVIYELSMQEAMAHYSGDDPIQGGQEFMDTFFGMGRFSFELVPGYDCPGYADFLDTTFHLKSNATTYRNNICVFEYTGDQLLQRHTARKHVTVSRNTFLTVRFVSTISNYDYTFSYIFYLDGSIEVKISASGFIFGAFYAQSEKSKQEHYGYRVHDAAASSMHDHVINFKADLDIGGSSNEMIRIAIEPTTRAYPWEQPEVPIRNTMVLKEYPVTNETGLDWPKNSGEMYTIYHADKRNAWGERKGYRIVPGTGMGSPPHLTILNSTTLGRSARWSEHDVWVLRNKDTEPRSADPLNYLAPHDPILDFEKMANGESLILGENGSDGQEYDGDLVVYFNLGAHHVPHSGDIPNTLMHTSSSSVMFVPHNFVDRDPSRETVQGVRIDMKNGIDMPWEAASDKAAAGSSSAAGKVNEDEMRPGSDLRSRVHRNMVARNSDEDDDDDDDDDEEEIKVRYYGKTYTSDIRVSKEMLEPDQHWYHAEEHLVSDLSLNGGLFGIQARGRDE